MQPSKCNQENTTEVNATEIIQPSECVNSTKWVEPSEYNECNQLNIK